MIDHIITGHCLEHLASLKENSCDCLITDPPYTIRGVDWDRELPSVSIWKECIRVLKPGSFAFVMSCSRQDIAARTIVNLQDAGFKTAFSPLYWAYASGFTRATNILETLKKRPAVPPDAGQLQGAYGGFQPKTAVELVLVAMKGLSKRNFVEQALANRRGVTWLDQGRIPYADEKDLKDPDRFANSSGGWAVQRFLTPPKTNPAGRFAPNLLVADDVLNQGRTRANRGRSFSRYFDLDVWWRKQIESLPSQVQRAFPFLVVPKPGRKERDAGCEEIMDRDGRKGNLHDAVKPFQLMAYLVSIGTRPGDLIVDPYAGSGTTCMAAKFLGRHFIGIEKDEYHCRIARARVARVPSGDL